jgi:hypothetical protein
VNEDYSWKNKDYLIMDSVLLFEMRKLFKKIPPNSEETRRMNKTEKMMINMKVPLNYDKKIFSN